MQSLRSPRANCSSLAHIYGDIKCIAMGFRTLSISCVKRSANSATPSISVAGGAPQPAQDALYVDSIGLWMNEMGLCPQKNGWTC